MKCLTALKFYQTQSNTIKQGVQMKKCLMTKQCLIVFDRQTFPVWTGLYSIRIQIFTTDLKTFGWVLVGKLFEHQHNLYLMIMCHNELI